MGSSNSQADSNSRGGWRRGHENFQGGGAAADAAAAELAKGVASMSMDSKESGPSQQDGGTGGQKVYRLDSFVDSSGTSLAGHGMSMHERLMRASNLVARRAVAQLGDNIEEFGAAMEIDKQKRGKDVAGEDKSRGDSGPDGVLATEGVSPAKRCKISSSRPSNLTGAHRGPRQEQCMLWHGTAEGWDSRTVHELCDFIKSHHPKLIFLSETRMCANRVSNLKWRLGLRNCLPVGSVGLSGSLALFRDESINVTLLSQGKHHIDVLIQKDPNSMEGHICIR